MRSTDLSTARANDGELFVRYRREDDLAARRELVERFLPLARRLAQRYAYTGEPLDDLVQVASMALLKAIDRFEPERGRSFTAYAAPTILGELKRHFRDKSWALRVPRGLQERALEAQHVSERLAAGLGRAPSVREVARELGRSAEEVLEAQEAARSHGSISLDAPTTADGDGIVVSDRLGEADPGYQAFENHDALAVAWRRLSPLERRVLELRFFRGFSQREIGEAVGVSQMQVSRVMRSALAQLEQTKG